MRELTITDLNVVAGGETSYADLVAMGTALGGGIGASLGGSLGLGATDSLALAGLGSAWLGGATAAGIAGWAIGQGLNEHTPIQEWIANMLDEFNQSFDGDQ